MALATYKDFCIDAVDPARIGTFWGSVLGLEAERLDDGDFRLTGPTPRHTIWVNTVPEANSVKQRVHLDVWVGTVADVEAAGGRVVSELPQWTLMADPEGGEFCAFVSDDSSSSPRHLELVVDTAEDAKPVADWWGTVLGAAIHHDERGYSYVSDIPDCPLRSIAFVPVPEPKTVKNRLHIDVHGDVEALVDLGARVLDQHEQWAVLADPAGNEFCVFAPAD